MRPATCRASKDVLFVGSGNAEFTVTVATLEEDIGAADGLFDCDGFGSGA